MKKLFTLAAFFMAAVCVFGFVACAPQQNEGDKVTLVGLSSGADVLARDDIDYFVVPEPAASVRIKATANSSQKLNLVGDLQQLYGGDNGYPQAVAVVKNTLLKDINVAAFVAALQSNAEWLAAESTQISSIVYAVTAHLTAGMTPTFNTDNLTKEVIANCGIRFTEASSDKQQIKSFLTELKAVQPAVKDDPADKFFWNGESTEASSVLPISVYAPDGAPALALAGLMAGEIDTSSVAEHIDYNVVDASTIQTKVTGSTPVADICILPVNLAANLLGSGENYTLLGTVTHGNLFILSAKTSEKLTAENISCLCGKSVGVVNLAAVPGLTFKLILKKYGLEY